MIPAASAAEPRGRVRGSTAATLALSPATLNPCERPGHPPLPHSRRARVCAHTLPAEPPSCLYLWAICSPAAPGRCCAQQELLLHLHKGCQAAGLAARGAPSKGFCSARQEGGTKHPGSCLARQRLKRATGASRYCIQAAGCGHSRSTRRSGMRLRRAPAVARAAAARAGAAAPRRPPRAAGRGAFTAPGPCRPRQSRR